MLGKRKRRIAISATAVSTFWASAKEKIVGNAPSAHSYSVGTEKTPSAGFSYLDTSAKERLDRLAQRQRQSHSRKDNVGTGFYAVANARQVFYEDQWGIVSKEVRIFDAWWRWSRVCQLEGGQQPT